MTIQKSGGIAAIIQASTYIFGMILFLGILNTSNSATPIDQIRYLIDNRDIYYIGYIVIGLIFSFSLIVLVRATFTVFKQHSKDLIACNSVVGYIWACIVISAYMIHLVHIGVMANLLPKDPEMAITVNHTIKIITSALGGGIELIGAVWVLGISFLGLKFKIFSKWLHYWGYVVSISGVLTLFSGISFLSENILFSLMTAIFGLGQIIWFVFLGIALLKFKNNTI